jgi:hypothetical protein
VAWLRVRVLLGMFGTHDKNDLRSTYARGLSYDWKVKPFALHPGTRVATTSEGWTPSVKALARSGQLDEG